MALDDSVVQALEQRVREQTGQNVQLESKVDPDILGGIVLRVGQLDLGRVDQAPPGSTQKRSGQGRYKERHADQA